MSAGDPKHIPAAWPRLLSRDQACAYLGMSANLLIRTCTVEPRDMGANIVRYDRMELDAWVDRLPPRLTPRLQGLTTAGQGGGPEAEVTDVIPAAAPDRLTGALDRVQARVSGGARRWKTAS